MNAAALFRGGGDKVGPGLEFRGVGWGHGPWFLFSWSTRLLLRVVHICPRDCQSVASGYLASQSRDPLGLAA